ncbi:MAG: 30S ribosomal protein S11 [Candidatus Saccharimonadales bacterium]|nr:30S ribosomal protein S11 [Candidatus Saccharimonadales bacterium]
MADTEDKKTNPADKPVEDSVEKPAKSTGKRKKSKRSVPAGQVHIQATFNNTIVTVTDKKGAVLTSSSAGSNGFRGSKKGTAYAAQIASENAVSKARQNHGLSRVDVYVKGIGLGRESAIRALQNADVAVESIKDVTPVAHGGVRPRKSPRG